MIAIKYFVTFINFLLCLIILFFLKGVDPKENKATYIGFSAMIAAYVGSTALMWC